MHRPLASVSLAGFLLAAGLSLAGAPAGYYDPVAGLTGAPLKAGLHDIVDDHARVPYTHGFAADTWDVLMLSDEDPDNPANVRTVYRNESVPKSANGTLWDREHSWPNSLGFSQDGGCNYPYSDVHMLFPTTPAYNGARDNSPYDECVSGCNVFPVDGFPCFVNLERGSGPTGTWETWAHRKGDVARAILYGDVRYEGGTHGITLCPEPDLVATDDRGQIVSDGSMNFSPAYMGVLGTLLEWHRDDPPDMRETNRNDVVFSFQGNRNPFVDRPEFACDIWGGVACAAASTPTPCPTGTPTPTPGPGGGAPWVNEIHYDDVGADNDEGFEIAGPAGTDLSGWSMVFYNGAAGMPGVVYGTANLAGAIPDQANGFGTLWFPFAGFQNGPADAFALVDELGTVVQFLGYEGTLTATEGPAAGTTSADIGVRETSSTPNGRSLQLRGDCGNEYGDFAWVGTPPNTRGQPNTGQLFCGGATPGPSPTASPAPSPTGSPGPTPTMNAARDWRLYR